ncbi:MAG: bifunctional precorrin-2 dehydrogenase/sirohydrochlorin ferrochelatase [Cytophagales bacterium]|nr:bifunctional precorrin-2 dehydrogenase/sirohydrochlorin ferrochelatase [Cytophagales bacterium]MDW8383630.1 bifunctional precorrin-2 dehydrogenase/sirohydrochlorin ferrochelatase [Flammeovirgaceae bacterium]
MTNHDANRLFPVFFKLENLHTLIVGGGNVGLEKLEAILRNSPNAPITLVATQIKEEIKKIAQQKSNLNLLERPFCYTDLEGKDLVILATNDRHLHRCIKAMTSRMHLMTNVADTPELCDFYLSSIVQKGNLKIAISTNGKSPTIAKRIRELLEEVIPDSFDEILEKMVEIRKRLKGDFRYKVEKLNEITTEYLKKES